MGCIPPTTFPIQGKSSKIFVQPLDLFTDSTSAAHASCLNVLELL